MWLLSIVPLLLLLTLLPSMAMNNTTDIDDYFMLTIKFQYANCSNPHSSSSDNYNVSDFIAYREDQNQNADADSFFTDAKSIRKLTLNSSFINPLRRGQTKCGQENDGIRLCEYNYKISGKNEVDDRIRKFAFRLLTPLSLQDDYTCCWSFDSVQINRNFNDTITNKDILPFNSSNMCVKQPQTCVHSNVTWICPRTSNEIVFESGVFIGNYSSHSVTYANPDNCDDDRFQQTDILPTCLFQTDNEPAITMQSSSGSIISSSVPYIDTSTITSIGQSSSPIMVEPTSSFTLQLSTNAAAPSPSSVAKMCVSDGVWDSVSAGTNVTLSTGVKECYNGTVEAIRFCHCNGSWGSVQCIVSSTFNNTLNQIITAPVEGLQRLSEAIDFIPLSQSVVLLDKALEIALKMFDDIDKKKFLENFLNVSAIIISDILPTCLCQTNNEPAITMQSSNGISSIISSPVCTDTSTIASIGQCSTSIMIESFSSIAVSSTNAAAPSPSSVAKICVSDGVWNSVSAGANVTLSTGVKECYNGTVEAIRFCHCNGSWGSVQCLVSSTFNDTLNQIITAPVEGLQRLSEAIDFIPLSQSVVLLDKALEIALELSDDIDKEKFAEDFLNISSNIISSLITKDMIDDRDDDETDSQSRRVVSQLLQSLDTIALTFIEPSEDVLEFSGSFLKVTQVEARSTTDSDIVGIKVSSNSITLPDTIFKDTATSVHIGSFLFSNLSLLLSPLDTNSSIISPIISSTTNCASCPVTDLTEPVLITLQIENSLDLLSNREMNISCVFYDFKNQNGLLPTGDWNSSGCTTEVNGDLVTCSCNHLTHFAILLSPGGPEISATHYKVLNTIGLVLVPISLLCMVLVILTYTLIRSLWSIRNYIHVMLCASLFMAQLVFIIGVDKIENQGACSAVAVILLYLFLVTFMWMLMEGVVLYVTLVRVFINHHKYYIIAFTVASYVIPALYMALVVPIGFLVTENTGSFLYYAESKAVNHPHLTACWLNYSTGFIWSFIAPVIVIIMVNIAFFIMTIFIAQKNSSKQKMGVEIRHWLQVTISLTVVMGIAWLGGVLAFRRELLPVAYFTSIFIAAQGIILFIVLVPLSKQSNNNPRQEEFVTGKDTSKTASVQLTSMQKKPEEEAGFSKPSKA